MKTTRPLLLLAALLAVLAAPARAGSAEAQKVDFKKDVQPILKQSCVKCHGLDKDKPNKRPAAKLRLDDKASALKGGKSGVAIVPGDSKKSLLFQLLKGPVPSPEDEDSEREIDPMPKVKRGETWKPLPAEQIDVIGRWIDQGAVWSD